MARSKFSNASSKRPAPPYCTASLFVQAPLRGVHLRLRIQLRQFQVQTVWDRQ